jgi:hypothetical protein
MFTIANHELKLGEIQSWQKRKTTYSLMIKALVGYLLHIELSCFDNDNPFKVLFHVNMLLGI